MGLGSAGIVPGNRQILDVPSEPGTIAIRFERDFDYRLERRFLSALLVSNLFLVRFLRAHTK